MLQRERERERERQSIKIVFKYLLKRQKYLENDFV